MWACGLGHVAIVSQLLSHKGIKVDLADSDKWQALHWAARQGFPDIVSLLISQGAKFNVVCDKGTTPLIYACQCKPLKIGKVSTEHNFTAVIELLLSKGADISLPQSQGWNAFHVLCSHCKDPDVVTKMIGEGADINALTGQGATPLILAVESNFKSVVKVLVKHGADLNIVQFGFSALHKAIFACQFSSVDLFLAKGANPNLQDDDSETALHLACRNGHAAGVKSLIKAKAKLNIQRKDRATAIYIASKNGHTACVDALAKAKGIDINLQEEDGCTPVWIASYVGHQPCLHILLQAGADPDLQWQEGATPLCAASQEGHSDCVDELVNAGANTEIDDQSKTPLIIASQSGHPKCVEHLLKGGANVNACRREGATSLYMAAQNGHAECVDLLIKSGADLNISENDDGVSPLCVSAQNGHVSCTKALIKAGADVNHQRDGGATALYMGSKNGKSECVKALIKAKADINIQVGDMTTALIKASEKGHLACVELLLKAKASINLKRKDGATAVYLASQNGHSECVDILVQNKASVDVKEHEGCTALWIACQEGYLPVVTTLVKAGADLNVQWKKNGNTPLFMASKADHLPIVELLLKSGANPSLCDKDEWTPLHVASYKGWHNSLKALLKVSDIEAKTDSGTTALGLACKSGHTICLEILLAAGADPLVKDRKGQQPMLYAVKAGKMECVAILMKHKVPCDVAGTSEELKERVAKYRKNPEFFRTKGESKPDEDIKVALKTLTDPKSASAKDSICEYQQLSRRFLDTMQLPGSPLI